MDFKKLNIKFSIVILMVSIFILTILFIKFNNPKSLVRATKNIGDREVVGTDLTYMNIRKPFEDNFTLTYKDGKIQTKDISDVRVTIDFADISSLERYIKTNDYKSTESFLQKYGYVYLYHQYKTKKFYLLQNKISTPQSWNILVEDDGKYDLIKICDIKKEDNIQDEFSNLIFSKKWNLGMINYMSI